MKWQIEELEYKIKIGEEGEEYNEVHEVKGDIIHDMKELEIFTKKINKENKKININLLHKVLQIVIKLLFFMKNVIKLKIQ